MSGAKMDVEGRTRGDVGRQFKTLYSVSHGRSHTYIRIWTA